MNPQLTLYGAITSPFAEKIELALNEGNIAYKYYAVNLRNKPAFFKQLNPIGKVPVITYGGPDVPPEEPSPVSSKLAESNVILDFLAEIYPEAKLTPTNPVQRAKIRHFMDAVARKYSPVLWEWILDKPPLAVENHLKAIEFLQRLLSDEGKYAIGDSYTIADACITPFIYRLHLSVEHDIGKFPEGSGPKFGQLLKDPKYAKFSAYASGLLERPATKELYASRGEIEKQVWIQLLGRESTFEVPLEYLQGRA